MKIRSTTKSFFAGAGVYACTLSLWMDYLGKDGTINHVDTGWINPHITVPIAIIVFIGSLIVYAKEQREEKEVMEFFKSFRKPAKKE